jgi:integrase
MTGSVRKRGSTWYAYWFVTDPSTGKSRQRSKGGFKTKKAAQTHLNEVLGRILEGSWSPNTQISVKQLILDHWLPAIEDSRRPATIAQYRNVAKDWLIPHLGAAKATALTPADVKRMIVALQTVTSASGRKGLSPRSVQLAVTLLKASYSWALKARLLSFNPIAAVERPAVPSRAATAWSADEARTFLAATSKDRLAAAWALLLTRGLRRGELCGLQWDVIDLDAGTLQLRRSRIVIGGQAVEGDVKTAAGRRSIPLDEKLVKLLKSLKTRQGEERLAAGTAYSDGDFVICDELGRPYHPQTISSQFERYCQSTGLRRIRLHDLRHTAASLMLAAGEPVKVVQEMLGHSSPQITLAIYAHVMPGMSESAGKQMSNLLLA